MEEVSERVFERHGVVKIPLEAQEIEVVNKIAKSEGLDSAELIREWIFEKIHIS